jgi:hypothetical protein
VVAEAVVLLVLGEASVVLCTRDSETETETGKSPKYRRRPSPCRSNSSSSSSNNIIRNTTRNTRHRTTVQEYNSRSRHLPFATAGTPTFSTTAASSPCSRRLRLAAPRASRTSSTTRRRPCPTLRRGRAEVPLELASTALRPRADYIRPFTTTRATTCRARRRRQRTAPAAAAAAAPTHYKTTT